MQPEVIDRYAHRYLSTMAGTVDGVTCADCGKHIKRYGRYYARGAPKPQAVCLSCARRDPLATTQNRYGHEVALVPVREGTPDAAA